MKNIIPKSQSGFDLVVDFVFADDSVRTEKISLRSYFTDEVESFEKTDKEGNPVLDEEGQPVIAYRTKQVWHNPADNLQEFLQAYALALEAGTEAEKPPTIDPLMFGQPL